MYVSPLRDIKLILPLVHAVALAGEHRASLGRPRFDDTLAPYRTRRALVLGRIQPISRVRRMGFIADDVTLRALLERRAARDPHRVYLVRGGRSLTFSELDAAVNRLANGLAERGIGKGTRVAVMLDNHPELVCLFFALAKLGALQIPVNTRLKGDPLAYLLAHAEPAMIIAESGYAPVVGAAVADDTIPVVRRGADGTPPSRDASAFAGLWSASDAPPPGSPTASHVLTVLYTSGTTGPPKGVLVTDKMHRACAAASAMAADVRPGDVMHLWEPLYHIGGIQVLVLALEHDVTIALGGRFSASGFWREVRESGATQIHFLGGILQMLLAQPPRADDRDHRVRVAWGGGAAADVWRAFEARFAVQVRESYGMTEASSLTSINVDARFGSVGRPAPWFEVRIAADDGAPLGPGARGEILVREREPGLITPGYFRDRQATARAIRDGWLHTGDLGYLDAEGYLHFCGRSKDCVRHRGENVSAWEVERVVERLDGVEECAVIGVASEVGEEDIKLFVKPSHGAVLDPDTVFAWCAQRLAGYQVPRYLAVVDGFEKTSTQRIRKETLPRTTGDCRVRSEG